MTNDDGNDLMFDILASGGAVVDMPLKEDGTPDGEAFNHALTEAFASFPPIWERLKDRPEWSTPKWLGHKQVAGHVACGIVQACMGTSEVPEDMTGLIRFIMHELEHHEHLERIDTIFKASLCQLAKFLTLRLEEHKGFHEANFDREAAILNALNSLNYEIRAEEEFDRSFKERWAKEHPEERA